MLGDRSNKKPSYRRGTARAVKTVLNVAQMFVELHLISHAVFHCNYMSILHRF